MRRKKNKANKSVNLQVLPVVHPNAAGIDVGAKEHVVTVALESTGIYWISLFEVLEQYGFEIRVVNARHVKHVPDRTKTDVLDCQWIQKLHSFGLLNGSFRPDRRFANCEPICACATTWSLTALKPFITYKRRSSK